MLICETSERFLVWTGSAAPPAGSGEQLHEVRARDRGEGSTVRLCQPRQQHTKIKEPVLGRIMEVL